MLVKNVHAFLDDVLIYNQDAEPKFRAVKLYS